VCKLEFIRVPDGFRNPALEFSSARAT
jgi:hypothetical protein